MDYSKRDNVVELLDLVQSDKAHELTAEQLESIKQTLKDCRIERFEIPSDCPGVYGHPGASPKQLDLQEAFFDGGYRIVAASGANQSSKTIVTGGLCFCKYLRDYAQDGQVFWVIAPSNSTLRDIPHKTLWEFLPEWMFPENVEYSPRLGFGQIPTLHLTLPDGRGKCEVWFKTEEQDLTAFESSRVDGIWWTEPTKEQIFFSIQPRLAAKGGWLLMDFVPTQPWHQMRIKEASESGVNPYIFHRRFSMMDNAHNLAEGAIEYQRAQMSSEQAAVRIDGKDAAGFGVVYKQFDPERHVVEPFTLPPETPKWRTLDYGYRNPTACLWVAALPPSFQLPDGRVLDGGGLVVFREHYASERTVDENVRDILAMSLDEGYESIAVMDPTATAITQANGRSIADEFTRAGLPVRPGMRVNQFGERAMVEEVRKLFENDQLFFFSSCPWAIYEHRVWRYKENKEGEVPGREPFEDRNNHTCDALKLLVAEGPSWYGSIQGDVMDHPSLV